jgi:nitroimidazol reductase NimA-like FMN-containing flavoprotein (pyridoxamine 5'-phosphate oxidase superfamily)
MTDFRPLRRFRQAATEEECLRILRVAQRGVLSVIGEEGYPYGLPINFIFDQEKIYFHCAKEGHKLDAIRKNDKVCFTVLSEPEKKEGEWWYCFTSVIVFGHIQVVDNPAIAGTMLRFLGAKYFPTGYDIESDLQKNGPKALVLELIPDHISGKHVREK